MLSSTHYIRAFSKVPQNVRLQFTIYVGRCSFYMTAFPEEDQLEYAVIEAQQKYEKLQSILNSESRAAEILARASRTMDACQANMQQALQLSRNGKLYCMTIADRILKEGF
jgi:hypothetical protein